MNLNQLIQNDPIRALIWSATGTGKTTAGAMCVSQEIFRPLYIMDWDLRSASLRARIPQDLWQFIEVDPFRDTTIPGESFTRALSTIEKVALKGFKTLMIDSATFMMTAIMAKVLYTDGGKPPTTTPQLQNYMQQQGLVIDFISRLCGKPLNIIMTAHEDTSKDEITGRLFKALDLTGKLANRIPGYFNELWHCEVSNPPGKDPEYRIRTRSDSIYAARTSFRSVEPMESQFSIWAKIAKEKQSSSVVTIEQPTNQPSPLQFIPKEATPTK